MRADQARLTVMPDTVRSRPAACAAIYAGVATRSGPLDCVVARRPRTVGGGRHAGSPVSGVSSREPSVGPVPTARLRPGRHHPVTPPILLATSYAGWMAKRAYHHGDLRRALLVAAVEVIEESGPAALSLRDLARRAGVSHAAPQHHFGDKAGLLTAVAAEGYRRLATALEA